VHGEVPDHQDESVPDAAVRFRDRAIPRLHRTLRSSARTARACSHQPRQRLVTLEEKKFIKSEATVFKEHWTPHTLRRSWITNADQKVKVSDAHQRALTIHKPTRQNGDAHAGYIHPDIDDLREGQQRMTFLFAAQIKPIPVRDKKASGNVIPFGRARA
jgi:hypothetical protein